MNLSQINELAPKLPPEKNTEIYKYFYGVNSE